MITVAKKTVEEGKERRKKLKEGRFVKSAPGTTKNNGSKYGLKELSNDIIREVLRHQPSQINGFIADYLETMLEVRENTRDSAVVISDVLNEGAFFDQLHRQKNVDRKQVSFYATVIQAAWRGYATRKRIAEWLQKKKKIEENREVKRELKIEEFLASLGITYSEARRAGRGMQAAYKETKRGKWIAGELGEFWVAETVPFGERLKEDDRVQGRYRQWEIEDFGDFFEMDEAGAIMYDWPKVGQLRKVLRDEVPPNVPIVEFFAMRDLEGKEQYSYLIKTQSNDRNFGHPIGFLVPRVKYHHEENEYPEVAFTDHQNEAKMGRFTYVFRDDVKREEVQAFAGILKAQYDQTDAFLAGEAGGENEVETSWVLPRVLIRIKKDVLQPNQDEMKFVSLQQPVTCEQGEYTFVAETIERSLKIMKHIMRNPCLSVEDGLNESANMKPYKLQETGRIFPVEKFIEPLYIQKIHIPPESSTAEEESVDIMLYSYIFLPPDYRPAKQIPKAETTYSIPIIRFQGYHSDYKGSIEAEEDNKVFIMGPKLPSPDGKPFTYESLFWDEYGIEAWYQLLYNREAIENEMAEEEMKPTSQEMTTRLDTSKTDSTKQKGLSESLLPSTTTQDISQSMEPSDMLDQSMEVDEKQEKVKTSDEEGEEEELVEDEERQEKEIKYDQKEQSKVDDVEEPKSEPISSTQNIEPEEEKPKEEPKEEETPEGPGNE